MRRIESVLIFIIFLLVPTLAGEPARQSAVPLLGALEGTVVDSLTGEGLFEAQIRLVGIDVVASDQLLLKPEFSDGRGRFAIRNLPPGRYTVLLQNPGYIAPEPPPVIVVSASRTASVTLRMIPGGTIAGRVTADGRPQSGVTVQAFQIVYLNGYPLIRSVASRVTDDRGRYRLFYLRPDEYLVAVTPRDTPKILVDIEQAPFLAPASAVPAADEPQPTFYPGTVDRSTATRVLVGVGREVVNIDIPVRTARLFRVSGEIRLPAPSAPQGTAVSGRAGRAGSEPPPLPISSFGMALAGSDRPPTPSISRLGIALHDSSAPDDLGSPSLSDNILLQPSGEFMVGNFEVNNVPPGVYDGIVNVLPCCGRPRIPVMAFPFEVRGSDVEGLRFDLRPGVTVKARMTVDGEPPGANKGYVRFQIDGVFSRSPLAARFDVLADEKTGDLSVPDVPAGRFRAVPGVGLPPNLYIDDVRSGDQSVFDSGFEVGTVEPPPTEVLLRSGATVVAGAVVDDAGKPVGGAAVALVPALSHRQNLARFHDVVADADGNFSVSSVAPGEYKLFAWSQASLSGAAYNAVFLSRFEDNGVPVTISGKAATVTVLLTAFSPQTR